MDAFISSLIMASLWLTVTCGLPILLAIIFGVTKDLHDALMRRRNNP